MSNENEQHTPTTTQPDSFMGLNDEAYINVEKGLVSRQP